MDAVPALLVGAVRRGLQRRRLHGSLQPRRRDLRRGALPARGGGRDERQGRRVRLQPLAGLRRLGDAARAAPRRYAERTARGDHGAHRGPLPGARRRPLQRRLPERLGGGLPCREDARRYLDLLAGRRSRDRRSGRRGRADRAIARARALRRAPRRLRQHVHVRASRRRRLAVPRRRAPRRQQGQPAHRLLGAALANPRRALPRQPARSRARRCRRAGRSPTSRSGRRRRSKPLPAAPHKQPRAGPPPRTRARSARARTTSSCTRCARASR